MKEYADRTADESDRASNIEHANNEEAVKKQLRNAEKRPAYFDGTHCIDCDTAIPEERLHTGAWRDLYCQERYEKLKKDYNR